VWDDWQVYSVDSTILCHIFSVDVLISSNSVDSIRCPAKALPLGCAGVVIAISDLTCSAAPYQPACLISLSRRPVEVSEQSSKAVDHITVTADTRRGVNQTTSKETIGLWAVFRTAHPSITLARLIYTRHVRISAEILVRSVRCPRDAGDTGPLSACLAQTPAVRRGRKIRPAWKRPDGRKMRNQAM